MKRRVLLGMALVLVASSCGGTAVESGAANGGPAGAAGYLAGDAGAANAAGGASGRAGTGAGGRSTGSGGRSAAGASGRGPGAGRAGGAQAGAADDQAGAAGSNEQAGGAGLDHCTNGIRDADESDKDCGGVSCAPCTDSARCATASDCTSKVCNNNTCQHPTCNDQAQNQTETGIDCGGICADTNPCPNTAGCNAPSDCVSYVCSNKTCVGDLVVAPADVIDDFEDGDVILPMPSADHGNRGGSWFVFGDSAGVASRAVVAMKRGASSKVLHTTGTGFNDWGSGIGVDFNSDGTTKKPYDASSYSGVTFWARAGKATSVRVSLPDIDTDSTAVGHTCSACGHHFYRSASITTAWQRIIVSFSSLTPEAGGVPMPTTFAASGLVSLTLTEAALAPQTESYDLWLDDVAFVR